MYMERISRIGKSLRTIVGGLLVAAVLTGTASLHAKPTAELVYVNWAEGVAYTHLAKVILEEKMGYDVNITAAQVGAAYTAVAQGDKDAFMESWLPVLHKDYLDKYEDDLVDLGHVYEGTQSGLVVPEYVKVDKISGLNKHADKFDGQIVGIDAGAGVMKTTKQVIRDYGLDLKLVPSSGPAMTSALKKAVDEKEWIVVTGWKPHWMFARWDLKFLKQDPNLKKWKKGNIHIMGREDLKDDKPRLAKFLSNMHFTDKQLGSLMLAVRESGDDATVEDVAAEWMEEHRRLISQWIPEE